MRTIICITIFAALATLGFAQDVPKVPKVAMMWCFAENESGTNEGGIRTSNDLLLKLFQERAGHEVISPAIVRAGWKALGETTWESSVDDPDQLPKLPEAKRLLELGKAIGADYVCVGTLKWHVRSIWVGLGPKTKANAIVSATIIDVNKGEIALDAKGIDSNSSKAEKWFESAAALLVAWGFTLFSGGPKTPHIQKAAVKAIGTALEPFFAASAKKIGG
jgi:hypothetical protein